MVDWTASGTRTVPVDRLRPGDHACLLFDDDEQRWDVLGSFARTGFARGEKVLLADTATPADEVAERIGSHGASAWSARAALASGQLVVVRDVPRFTRGRGFDVENALTLILEMIELAGREGYSGVRASDDMAWALRPGINVDQLIRYEEAAHRRLFAGSQLIGMCQYDRKRFGKQLAATMSAVHPVTVVESVGTLRVTPTNSGLRIAGEADLATRQQLMAALHGAKTGASGRLVLDLTELSFMDAHCAGAIITMAAAMSGHDRLEVRCGPSHRRIFHLLGAATIPHLILPEG